MKPYRLLVAAALVTLVACTASPPPARELANELIDTLENERGPLADDVKACMHGVADGFALTESEAGQFDDLGKVFDAAADSGDGLFDEAAAIVERFDAELRGCR